MRTGGVALLGAALALASCGTRLPDDAFAPTTEVVSVTEGDRRRGEPGDAPGGAAGERPATGDEATPDGAGGTAGDTGSTGGAPVVAGQDGAGGDGEVVAAGPNTASDAGVTESTIRIGNITAETGVLGDTFAPAVRGLRAWVAHTNANGGIHGRQVELFTCDDREDRARTLECARRLVERDQVFALLATNTRAMGGAAQYLADQGVPVYGFPITNSFYRYPNFFSVYEGAYPRDGSSVGFDNQIRYTTGAVRWYREELGVSKAAVFSYDIAESRQAGEAFAETLRLEGYQVTTYVVSFAAPSFDQAVADMQRRGTQLVMDSMDEGANRRLCDAMARRRFQPVARVTTAVGVGASLGESFNATCRNATFNHGASRIFTADHPEVTEFRDAYARYQPGAELHQWALEAWAIGNIVRDALEAMGPAPTREGLIDFLDGLRGHTADDLLVPRSFETYPYPQTTARDCFAVARWLDSEGGWVQASDFPVCVDDARVTYAEALEQGN